jgi:hypothetical protein
MILHRIAATAGVVIWEICVLFALIANAVFEVIRSFHASAA